MEILKPYRAAIDALDDQIVDLLARRVEIIRAVGDLKAVHNIPVVLEDRVEAVRERCAQRGAEKGLDPDMVRQLYTTLITHCCDIERDIIQNTQRTA